MNVLFQVKINPVVNFDWEHKYYIGNLVAVHRNGIHIAYVLKGKLYAPLITCTVNIVNWVLCLYNNIYRQTLSTAE